MAQYLRFLILMLTTMFGLVACFGKEVVVIEDLGIKKILDKPSKYFEPLPEYTVGSITIFPQFIRDIRNDNIYFAVRAYTNNTKAEFKVKKLTIKINGNKIPFEDLGINSDDKQWKRVFDDWSYKVLRLREYQYSDIDKLDVSQIIIDLHVIELLSGNELEGSLNYQLDVSRKRYSSMR